MSSSENRRSYTMIDIIKIILALLIVVSHYINEYAEGRLPKLIDLSISVYIIAVPMYFAFSGFFLFSKILKTDEKKERILIKDYVLKIMRLYGVWSVIYVFFKVLSWIRFVPEKSEVVLYIHKCLVYSTYNTIWYLPASAVGVVIAYFIWKKLGMKALAFFALLFCVIGAMGDCYINVIKDVPVIGDLLDSYKSLFITSRNGVFNGFPYISVGAFAAYWLRIDTREYNKVFNRFFFLSVFFGAAFIAEAFISKKFADAPNSNTVVMLFPFTVCAVYWSIISIQPSINKEISGNLRCLSTTVFLSQRLFLSALPALFPGSFFAAFLSEGNVYFGIIWIVGVTVLFSAIIILISKKVRVVGYLYK